MSAERGYVLDMSLIESFQVQLGSKAPGFRLRGTDDRVHDLSEYEHASVLAVIFMCNHCPYVQACIERLVVLQRDFEDRGVQFVGINANDSKDYPDDSFEEMKIFAEKMGVNFPYLHDESQEVARNYHAACTPDIFVYDGKRELVYHGRIDNNWKDTSMATTHELRDALEALVSGGLPVPVQHPSMGCSIKWREM